MRRLLNALTEWLELRSRLREERRFHLDCSAAEFRSRGLTPRQARHAARLRFGRQSLRDAARELGSDLSGLMRLVRANRVVASAWLQPAVLLAVTLLILFLSSDPSAIVNGVLVRVHRVSNPGLIILTVNEPGSRLAGAITIPEFEALQSMTTLTQVERHHGFYVRGHAVAGATPPVIASEARNRTHNARLAAQFMEPRWELLANPAQSAWLIIAAYGAFLLFRYAVHWRWLCYGTATGILHAAASLAAWAVVMETRNQTDIAHFTLLFAAYLGVTAIQCRYWWSDLRRRCPICFERIVLPLTEGVPESMILRPAVTESLCVRGHGVLVESRWSLAFRPEASPLESLGSLK